MKQKNKKKNKKVSNDVVEISKSAFRNPRQSRNSSKEEIIRKTVDDVEEKEIAVDGQVEEENRNPDTDAGEDVMDSIETVEEDASITNEEDAIQIYRDVLSMTDEDRNTDADGKPTSVRLSPPPPPSWADVEENVKFKIGSFVRYKGNPNGTVYKVGGPSTKKDTYSIRASRMRDNIVEDGSRLVKVTDGDANWVDYWKLNPVIPAPKPWWLNKK
jgi:hypothetical protein